MKLVTLLAAFALTIVLMLGSDTSWWWIAAVGVLGLLFLGLHARRGRHTPWQQARGLVAPGHAVVLWKPGCTFCERLLLAVGSNDRISWVNVWVDEEANAEVRRLNGGNELTPTALVGERVLRNPSAEELLGALDG